MKVRFQYADHEVWEGAPEKAHNSPDKGIIRMYAIDDYGAELTFTYQDVYYLYAVKGGWLFGGASPWREFILRPGVVGCEGEQVPLELPENAVVRHGETVSQEEAVKFGLIETVDTKVLHKKRKVPVKKCKGCE